MRHSGGFQQQHQQFHYPNHSVPSNRMEFPMPNHQSQGLSQASGPQPFPAQQSFHPGPSFVESQEQFIPQAQYMPVETMVNRFNTPVDHHVAMTFESNFAAPHPPPFNQQPNVKSAPKGMGSIPSDVSPAPDIKNMQRENDKKLIEKLLGSKSLNKTVVERKQTTTVSIAFTGSSIL